MGCLGAHFALSELEATKLRSLRTHKKRVQYVREALEDDYFGNHVELLAQSDKAWDAMHRALADGELTWDGGSYPLNHVILAGEVLCTKTDFLMSLKTPEQVRDIADALRSMNEQEFRKRYFAINPKNYSEPLSEEDCAYTWHWFQEVRRLYANADKAGRHVLFTADQ